MMEEKKEELDLLFERNAAEQLSGVDWGRLSAGISARVDEAARGRVSVIGLRRPFEIAAGLAAAAAVFVAVMFAAYRPADVRSVKEGSAMVRFTRSKGAASVQIGRTKGESPAMVDFKGEREVARCEVEIVDRNGDLKRDEVRPAWVIISVSEPVLADNGVSRYDMDLICLF
ncbi:MAG: hypothetical protein ACYSR5_05905 [Planctomycetota bacterium]|jgi:hypothetical protein